MVLDAVTELPTPEDTRAYGERIGALLTAGDLVVLSGPLGAGKTVLVKGIAAGMGITERISSPTFVLARVHAAGARGVGLVHVDAYRLGGDLTELEDLGVDTGGDVAVVAEWGEGLLDRIADDVLLVRIDRRADDVRVVELEPHGTWAERIAPALP